jgi:hypothetical protein
MPSNVKIFWCLSVLIVSYAVISREWHIVFPPPLRLSPRSLAALAKVPEALRERIRTFDIEYVMGAAIVVNGTKLLFAWLATFKRKNWARWAFAILFVFLEALPLIAYFVSLLFQSQLTSHYFGQLVLKDEMKALFDPYAILFRASEIAAIVFVFTGNARDWFKAPIGA